jgi:organic hydroperoxide reductase OsmC/OhrA
VTPEHLFAAGYAACFGGAVDFVSKQKKTDASKAKVTCAVTIGTRFACHTRQRRRRVRSDRQ